LAPLVAATAKATSRTRAQKKTGGRYKFKNGNVKGAHTATAGWPLQSQNLGCALPWDMLDPADPDGERESQG
jgi:hypothetical protein